MKLSVKPGKLDKIHIFLDEEYAMTVDNTFWFSSEWYNKTEIDSEELAALQTAVSSRRAFNAAVDLLSRRAHGSEELYKNCVKNSATSRRGRRWKKPRLCIY